MMPACQAFVPHGLHASQTLNNNHPIMWPGQVAMGIRDRDKL